MEEESAGLLEWCVRCAIAAFVIGVCWKAYGVIDSVHAALDVEDEPPASTPATIAQATTARPEFDLRKLTEAAMSSAMSSLDSRMKTSTTPATQPSRGSSSTSTLAQAWEDDDYRLYAAKVPEKYKTCNPITHERCLVINRTCVPCTARGGGQLDVINAKYYRAYYEQNLDSCAGAAGYVLAHWYTGQECDAWEAVCIQGRCEKQRKGEGAFNISIWNHTYNTTT